MSTPSTDTNAEQGGFGETLKSDLPASLVVFLVALPLCMGIAIASGVPVHTGIITGIIGGIVVGTLAGAPLQVSGPAAGLTVLVFDLVQTQGYETLGIVVLLAGAIQILAGLFKLGQWFRAVSPAVIKGMLAGIGVLILSSQFHVMVDDAPKKGGLQNLLTIPEAIYKGIPWPHPSAAEQSAKYTEYIRALGNLHAEQVVLEETIDEHIPRDLFTPGEEPDLTWIESATAEQVRIQEHLKEIVTGLEEHNFFEDTKKGNQRRENAKLALEHVGKALDELQAEDVLHLRQSQASAAKALDEATRSMKNHDWAAKIGLLTILILIFWRLFLPGLQKILPASLVAVSVATGLAAFFTLPILYVEVPDNLLGQLHFPSIPILMHSDWRMLLKWAIVIAAVASAETLLCATAVDQLHTGQRTKYDRELWAQGVGNVLCGSVGALPMTGVIVRSTANLQAGGRTRLSAILHGFWLLIFVVFLYKLLAFIPRSALAAILVYTGYKLIDIQAIKKLWEIGKSEVAIYAATVTCIVVFDLLTGVIIGIALAAVKLLAIFSYLKVEIVRQPEENKATMFLSGTATFVRLPVLAEKLESIPARSELHVDFEQLDYIDHACLELLLQWAKQHESQGGRLVLDWESFHASFKGEPKSQRERKNALREKVAAEPGERDGRDEDAPAL